MYRVTEELLFSRVMRSDLRSPNAICPAPHMNGKTLLESVRSSPKVARCILAITISSMLSVDIAWAGSKSGSPKKAQTQQEITETTSSQPSSLAGSLRALEEKVRVRHSLISERVRAESGMTDRIRNLFNAGAIAHEELSDISALADDIKALHDLQNKSFERTGQRIRSLKLSETMLSRQSTATAAMEHGYAGLSERLDALSKAESLLDQKVALQKIKDFLEDEAFDRAAPSPDPLAPLPFGEAPIVIPREPNKTLDPISANIPPVQRGIEHAMGAIGDALITPARADFIPPGSADLGETQEVTMSPNIRAKAAELQSNPIEIYNWVRNNIEWKPGYGSAQDADSTLALGKGNSFAISSLLIALLRASNVSSRYAYGVVEIPISKAQNWVGGAANANAALTTLQQAGIPVRGIVEGGRIVAIEMEHVWVETFIDFVPSRGVKNITPDTWVSLDASFKQYAFEVVGSGLTKKYVEPFVMPHMPSGLPYRLVATTARYSALPNALRNAYTVKVWRPLEEQLGGQPLANCSVNMAVLSKKGMALEFFAASADDATLIRNTLEGDESSIPAYLVSLKANLRVGDESCAYSASELRMGDPLTLEIVDQAPGFSPIARRHALIAGESVVLGVSHDVTVTTPAATDTHQQTYGYVRASANQALSNALASYFSSVFSLNGITAVSKDAIYIPQPSFGVIRRALSVEYLFGVPIKASEAGYTTDVLSLQHLFVSKDGDSQKALSLRKSGGPAASLLEAKVLEDIVVGQATPRVTTVDVLGKAIIDGANVVRIDRTNIGIVSQFAMTQEQKNELIAYVQTGRLVITPDRQISIGTWIGIGYVVEAPDSGASAYKISGHLNGGYLDSRTAACPSPGKNAFLPIPMADPSSPVGDIDWLVRECVFEYPKYTIERFRLYTETLEALRNLIQTTRRAEMENIYQTTDSSTVKFVLHYYLGNGQDVHLGSWVGGTSTTLEESASVTFARAFYLSNVVIPALRNDPNGTPGSAEYDVHLTFEPGLFALGDGRITLSSQSCHATGVGNMVYACQFSGAYRDYFRDPLDLGAMLSIVRDRFSDSNIEVNVELPGGTPYNILNDWNFSAFAAVPQG